MLATGWQQVGNTFSGAKNKKNNMNKREFVLKGCELIKIDNLKKEAKEIILKYRINNEFIEKPNLGEGKKRSIKKWYCYIFLYISNFK